MTDAARHYRFADVALEKLTGGMTRRFVSGERLMLGEIRFAKGDVVPRHQHANEQITHVISGALQFWFGANDEHGAIARAGELVVIPANLPHRALALEDTLEYDIFTPPRQDWLAGTDAYLRG